MAAPRLFFLYPVLHQPSKMLKRPSSHDTLQEYVRPRPRPRGHMSARGQGRGRGFGTSSNRWLEPIRERHGTAVEPPPELRPGRAPKNGLPKAVGDGGGGGDGASGRGSGIGVGIGSDSGRQQQPAKEDGSADLKTVVVRGGASSSETEKSGGKDSTMPEKLVNLTPSPSGPNSAPSTTAPPSSSTPSSSSSSMIPESVLPLVPRSSTSSSSSSAASSSVASGPATTTAHAEPCPPFFLHPFDTYLFVQSLQTHGLTYDQSVSLMEAVRGLLTRHLQQAQEGLVSKSEAENETYRFQAACSELRTDIQQKRQVETDRQRTERGQLQHGVEIVSQKLTQDLLTLKDTLKGMFDDRKMEVRMEQKAMESKVSPCVVFPFFLPFFLTQFDQIQQLNYKITVSLNSDVKSEIEGLRWVLTRRFATAIATMVVLILVSLRYSSYRSHHQAPPSEDDHAHVDGPHASQTASLIAGAGAGVGSGVGAGAGVGEALLIGGEAVAGVLPSSLSSSAPSSSTGTGNPGGYVSLG
ncbi:MAG: hypothetical protein M1826_002684 [Phylliscum demangeonii]|nr:MAG: hypothetical protein M1826_002684 [Phylliscum demangeonii]